jgi:membrane protease YdiL (CAAX protease family)
MTLFAGLFSLTFAKVIMPEVKSHFVKTPFMEDLVTRIALLGLFASVLIGLAIMIKKVHKRDVAGLFSTDKKFSWRLWWSGFLMWAPIICLSSLAFNYNDFERFQSFQYSNIQLAGLLLIGLLGIGVQSTAEEIVFRGYILQGLSRVISKKALLVSLNSLIFGLLHMGYGFESLIESFVFGVVMCWIVIDCGHIEFVSGVHTVNNLVLISFFPPNREELSTFQWSVNWLSLVTFIFLIFGFYMLVTSLFKKTATDESIH